MTIPQRNDAGHEVFWTNGRIAYIQIYEGLFSLEVDGVEVMPPATFEVIDAYAKAEFKMPLWW